MGARVTAVTKHGIDKLKDAGRDDARDDPDDREVYVRATTVLAPYVFGEERPRRITADERRTGETRAGLFSGVWTAGERKTTSGWRAACRRTLSSCRRPCGLRA